MTLLVYQSHVYFNENDQTGSVLDLGTTMMMMMMASQGFVDVVDIGHWVERTRGKDGVVPINRLG